VTTAGSVGLAPAGPFVLSRSLGRSKVFACAGVLAALNAHADQIIAWLRYSPISVWVSNLCGISAVVWLAMAAAIKIGFEGEGDEIRRLDILVLAATVALSLVPLSGAPQAGLLLCAIYLFATSSVATASRRISIVLLSLTGTLIWGRLLLHSFAGPILALDSQLVAWLIGSPVNGNVVAFAGRKSEFVIGTGCSSVHNISLAIVLWVTAAALFKITIDRHYVLTGLVMIGVMFALNIARLMVIGFFPDHFDFLHEGGGAAIFAWAGLLSIALLVARGVIGAAARQR
jgi:exosortase/archaeosortase family protein